MEDRERKKRRGERVERETWGNAGKGMRGKRIEEETSHASI